jgi:hypothetical protein
LSHSFALTSVSLQETLVGWKKTSATRLDRLADATLIRIDPSNIQDCATETLAVRAFSYRYLVMKPQIKRFGL